MDTEEQDLEEGAELNPDALDELLPEEELLDEEVEEFEGDEEGDDPFGPQDEE